jgi:uncharacterized protein YkwD
MPRLLATTLSTAAATLALAAPAMACEGADLIPDAGNGKQVRQATLCLLNAERAQHGLGKLRQNERLRKAARRHSRAMVKRGFFEHTSPTGSTMVGRVSRAGYRSWASLGENIAWGSGHLATPGAIVRGWMNSPGHRDNILRGRFREIGIGVVAGAPTRLHPGEQGATYTTDFGVRR